MNDERTLTLGAGVPFVFRLIPAGAFWMGSLDSEPGHEPEESPWHRTVLARGFWMSQTPVTRREWAALLGEPMPAAVANGGTKVNGR